ncbi:hypothetical protein CcaverHIS002_0505700 [Cutaneotrichosporon cavernicola]|uniref:PWWP domain-containing protein n=1 Tax=Cutaneotrichosporon cavernicola TaxID=279322 RepID=A0AA48L6U6_9TREE|nr:uncharacterized protein CcaverHIS019_0506230 [Cutaneotrichosporon cavernicola]BEI85169.1 hypothetical protein CcaverHIS002_0505700 [Cutaneotrichosporon cavernicola]BEI92995.1 hypothetical protein CcaverHIS019_0506230 [Cutaneotrichosporon cavernicola]BEJ00771.1 hypothetical protein CcaverHIS631_0506280 [Cutaneotrichosporon cavernicola]BEJ08536.1 hypothetical protein CcaverHIS641_0506300 [Cutaneotrichosporon cavernicola]
MDQDREVKLKRDNSRRKTLNLIDSAPSSQTNTAPKAQPRKRKRHEEKEKRPTKKRSSSLGDAARPPKVPSREGSVSPTSTAASSSPLSSPRQLAGPSASTLYLSDEEDDDDDDELDLGTALSRHNATLLTADLFDDDDLSDPPTPKGPKWKKTMHPGVAPGDTCLVKYRRLWFPAKLLRMELAESAGSRDFYEVQTQDGKVYRPTRRGILFLYEGEAMAEVTIGQYETSAVHTGESTSVVLPDDASEYDRFRALPLSEQIGRLQGHLTDLAAGRYIPAKWRVEAFYKGKDDRSRLKEELALGDFKNSEIKQAGLALSDWVRDHCSTGRLATLADDERSQFASFVLLPEVIIAICIRSLDLDRPSSWARERDDIPAPEEAAEAEAARLYNLAREKLAELGENDHEIEWEKRRLEVKMAVKWAEPAVPTQPEPEMPLRRREARLRNPEEASVEDQARLLEGFARKKKQGDKRKGKAVAKAEAERSARARASAQPTWTNGREALEGTASATDGVEAREGEACATNGDETPENDVNGMAE